jgi:hypothetical protein
MLEATGNRDAIATLLATATGEAEAGRRDLQPLRADSPDRSCV